MLIEEYKRLGQELDSETTRLILAQLIEKTEMVDVDKESFSLCSEHFPPAEIADMVHASTCLLTGATLITNDTHFAKIKNSGLIRVWSISVAIRYLL